jgi:alpha-galactosidase
VNWKQLQIKGRYRIRDLWRQKDLGVSDSGFRRLVPFHGVLLVRLTSAEAATPLHPQIK